jgi:hypothetical protein
VAGTGQVDDPQRQRDQCEHLERVSGAACDRNLLDRVGADDALQPLALLRRNSFAIVDTVCQATAHMWLVACEKAVPTVIGSIR